MTDPRLTPERIADVRAEIDALGGHGNVSGDTASMMHALLAEREALHAENERLRALAEAAAVLLNKSYVYPQNRGDVSVARDALNTLVEAWKAGT